MSAKQAVPLFALLPLLLLSFCSPQVPQGNVPPPQELKRLAAEARTKADHETLAAYFRKEAEEARLKQREHEELLDGYGKAKPPFNSQAYVHCRRLLGYFRDAAENAEALAHIHEEFAKISPER